ncbi:MAG: phosphotransferase [Acidimicrobiia bacterium]
MAPFVDDESEGAERAAAAQVVERVTAGISAWYGDGSRLAATPSPPIANDWSFVFRIRILTGDDRLVPLLVKVPHWNGVRTLRQATRAGEQPSTRREFEALRAMAAAVSSSSDEGLVAVQPVAYLSDLNAIVVEELRARPLRDLIVRLGVGLGLEANRGRVAEAMERAGRWLRLFHGHAVGTTSGSLQSVGLVEELDELGARLAEMVREPIEALDETRRLIAGVHKLAGRDIPITTLHGDCNLSNVLVTPRGAVALIDMNPVKGPALQDLAKLVVEPAVLAIQALTRGWFLRHGAIDRWESALIRGYGVDERDRQVLDVFVAVAILRKWADVEASISAGAGSVVGMSRRWAARLVWAHLRSELHRVVDRAA